MDTLETIIMRITSIKQMQKICLEEGVTPSVLLEDVGYLEGILKSSMVSEKLLRGTIRMYKDGFIQTNQAHNPSEDADTCGHDQWMALQN